MGKLCSSHTRELHVASVCYLWHVMFLAWHCMAFSRHHVCLWLFVLSILSSHVDVSSLRLFLFFNILSFFTLFMHLSKYQCISLILLSSLPVLITSLPLCLSVSLFLPLSCFMALSIVYFSSLSPFLFIFLLIHLNSIFLFITLFINHLFLIITLFINHLLSFFPSISLYHSLFSNWHTCTGLP